MKTHPIDGSNSKVKAGWPLISVEYSGSTDLACLLANGELWRRSTVDARTEGVANGAKWSSICIYCGHLHKKRRYYLNIPILSMKSALEWSEYMSVTSFSITLKRLLHQRYRGVGAIDKAKT